MADRERTDGAGGEIPDQAGWDTFDGGVRDHRFAWCLERARASIEVGQFKGAREALNEAKKLAPDAPEIAELESIIALGSSPSSTVSSSPAISPSSGPPMFAFEPEQPRAGTRRVIAGMALAVVLCAMVAFAVLQIQHTESARQMLSMLRLSSTPDTVADEEKAAPQPASAERAKPSAPAVEPTAPAPATAPPAAAQTTAPAAPAADEKSNATPNARPTTRPTVNKDERPQAAPKTAVPKRPCRKTNRRRSQSPNAPALRRQRRHGSGRCRGHQWCFSRRAG